MMKERRHVVRKGQVTEKRFLPESRYPAVIHIVSIGTVLSLATRRARKVVKERGIDAMTPKSKHGLRPSAALHVIGADHDFIDVLDSEVGMMETRLPIKIWEWKGCIQQQQIVMIDGSFGAQVRAVAFLQVGDPKIEAL